MTGRSSCKNGSRLHQKDTLHSLVLKSKVNFGGFALAEAVKKIMDGPVETMVNDASQASYFSFPTPKPFPHFGNTAAGSVNPHVSLIPLPVF